MHDASHSYCSGCEEARHTALDGAALLVINEARARFGLPGVKVPTSIPPRWGAPLCVFRVLVPGVGRARRAAMDLSMLFFDSVCLDGGIVP